MPNWVKNVVEIKNLNTDEKYDNAINLLTRNYYNHDILALQEIDFNKIIPEPETKEDCSKKYILPEGDKHLSHDDGKEWFDWYNWRIDNWGTKWNASDCYIIFNKDRIVFTFNTAWSAPRNIILKIAELGFDFNWYYADEDIYSSNYGLIYSEHNDAGELKITEDDPSELDRETDDDYENFSDWVWAMYE